MADDERRRATLEDLQTPRLDQEDVELDAPDGGTYWVTVRALTRDEVTEARRECTSRDGEVDDQRQEYILVALSMVDPPMDEDGAAKWAATGPAGEFVKVLDRVRELSRLGEDAHKSDVPRNRRQRRAAVRARPGKGARRDDRR